MSAIDLAVHGWVLTTGAVLSEDGFYPAFAIVDRDGVEVFAWRARFGFASRHLALVHASEYGSDAARVLLE